MCKSMGAVYVRVLYPSLNPARRSVCTWHVYIYIGAFLGLLLLTFIIRSAKAHASTMKKNNSITTRMTAVATLFLLPPLFSGINCLPGIIQACTTAVTAVCR